MIAIIAAFLFGLAIFFILLDLFKVPYNKTFQSVLGLSKQMEGGTSRINTSLEALSKWFSRFIRLDEYKRATMLSDLRAAQMEDVSPEMFLANCATKAFVVGIFAIPAYPLWPLLSLVILLLSVLYYFNEVQSLGARVAARREAIEFELSQLVFTIEKTLRHNRDVLLMLDSYAYLAGPELQRELWITTADMRSGNYETAISRLETRVGSTMMSDVCRGLISIIRGDDTTAYWQSLELRFEDHRREVLKARASSIPVKVSRLAMILLVCFMAIWFIVIAVQVIDAMQTMFS